MLEVFSFLAISIISSFDNSSSIETLNIFDIYFNEPMLGYPFPLSHFDTAVLYTYNFSANCSCVNLFLFLNSCIFLLNSITIFLLDNLLFLFIL